MADEEMEEDPPFSLLIRANNLLHSTFSNVEV